MSESSIESVLEYWDQFDDDEVIVYTVVSGSSKKKVFYPTTNIGKEDRILRVFTVRGDADVYLSHLKAEDLSIKEISLIDMIGMLEGGKFKNQLENVSVLLSAANSEGKIYTLEKYWSFYEN